MSGQGVKAILGAADALYEHLDTLGEPGARLVSRTRQWRDGILRASDSEWARFYADALTAKLASGMDWQLGPEEARARELLEHLTEVVDRFEPSPWADVDLRSVQAEEGIGQADLVQEQGQPPLHR
ncbi:hypothetical protein GCM10027418_01940 [Mariniluteicoccus endophyticus]